MLAAHECEWRDVVQAREALERVFDEFELTVLESKERTTLFWRCR
jgi:hypothetical protein